MLSPKKKNTDFIVLLCLPRVVHSGRSTPAQLRLPFFFGGGGGRGSLSTTPLIFVSRPPPSVDIRKVNCHGHFLIWGGRRGGVQNVNRPKPVGPRWSPGEARRVGPRRVAKFWAVQPGAGWSGAGWSRGVQTTTTTTTPNTARHGGWRPNREEVWPEGRGGGKGWAPSPRVLGLGSVGRSLGFSENLAKTQKH